jgi:hypothetical protein
MITLTEQNIIDEEAAKKLDDKKLLQSLRLCRATVAIHDVAVEHFDPEEDKEIIEGTSATESVARASLPALRAEIEKRGLPLPS